MGQAIHSRCGSAGPGEAAAHLPGRLHGDRLHAVHAAGHHPRLWQAAASGMDGHSQLLAGRIAPCAVSGLQNVAWSKLLL